MAGLAGTQQPAATPIQSAPTTPATTPDAVPSSAVTDAERSAVSIVASDLDVHLTPADAREEVNATLTVRNVSSAAITRIPLQVSGSLRWARVALRSALGLQKVAFTQSPVATDTDHTGFAQEIVLEHALAPGAEVILSAFYGGKIEHSSARVDVLGADPGQSAQSEWDQIVPASAEGATALRGFGNVLWYPVAAPLAALGEGNRLFEVVARERRHNATATMRLRLTVEYVGDPPEDVIFNGRVQPLEKLPDEADGAQVHGVATAEFAAGVMGDRSPNLFLTAQTPRAAAAGMLSVFAQDQEKNAPYAEAVAALAPLMSGWFGAEPRVPLTLLDHAGAPFEDGPFVAARLAADARPETIAPELVRPLTHAYIAPASVWLDKGLGEFMGLLWTEQTLGRATAIAELRHAATLIALAEPADGGVGEPLTTAYSDVYLRLKSASVLWQLRELLGEEPFKEAMLAYRHSLAVTPASDRDPEAFQHSIETTTKADLGWFFSDWVYRDRGLPDLSLQHVSARAQLTSKSQIDGYLVAVEVKNDGGAVADVPVTVRSTEASIKERLRIQPHASASVRIFFRGRPETVEVNDGSVPELRTTTHTAAISAE